MELYPDFIETFERKGYFVFDHFLKEIECKGFIEEMLRLENAVQFKKAGIGRSENFLVDSGQRGDSIHWIDPNNSEINTFNFLAKLDSLIVQLNRTFYLGIRNYECHHTIYPAGSFYKKHVDRHKSGSSRVVSFVLYLNENWIVENGGELRIYESDFVYTDVAPRAGTLAIFLSEKEHEVLPTTTTRMSITGWMLNMD